MNHNLAQIKAPIDAPFHYGHVVGVEDLEGFEVGRVRRDHRHGAPTAFTAYDEYGDALGTFGSYEDAVEAVADAHA